MIQALIITPVSVGAGLIMLGGDNNEPPPPAPAVTQAPLVPAGQRPVLGGRLLGRLLADLGHEHR